MASSYAVDGEGKYIPATQRPDGTWRKARRIKDGYVPQDEVPLYESKGKQFAKSVPTLPPGLHPDDVAAAEFAKACLLGQNVEAEQSKSSKKKKKRKAKAELKAIRQDLARFELEEDDDDEARPASSTLEANRSQQPIQMDPVKRLKNLKKKLRDIEKLEAKIELGELAAPEKDQLEKISRKSEVEAEIAELESS